MAHESRILQMQSFVCSSLSVGGPLRDCPGHLWQHVQSRLQEPRWILSTAHWCGSLSWCLVKKLAYSLLVFALHDPTSCNMLHLTWLKVWFRSEQKGCCRQLPRSKNIWAVWPETSRKGSKSIFQIQRASDCNTSVQFSPTKFALQFPFRSRGPGALTFTQQWLSTVDIGCSLCWRMPLWHLRSCNGISLCLKDKLTIPPAWKGLNCAQLNWYGLPLSLGSVGFYGFPILIYSHSTRNNEQLAAKVERAERFSETRGRPTYASLGLAFEATL